jgi:hypothetical protein
MAQKSSRLYYSRKQGSLPCSIGMRTGLGDVAGRVIRALDDARLLKTKSRKDKQQH